jgi:site-specific DNA recombinase
MIRAALYARYSSDRQNERSIEDQLAQCSRLAGARGWVVVASFADAAISGAAMANRPGLHAALDAASRGEFDVLLTEDEDRIARNLEHQAHVFNRLRDLGVSIATMSSEAIGIMEVGLKGLMAELYLANLSQKTSRGMRSNAEKGLATGSRLFGYRTEAGGAMVIVEEQAAVIREIAARYAEGETARRIAADLNKRGVRGPRGGMWNASSINGSRQRGNGIVRTELYAGVKVWNRMVVVKDRATGRRTPRMKPESEWKRTPVPALRIVDEATWSQILERHEREEGKRPETMQARRRGLFSGLLKCRCGAATPSTRRPAHVRGASGARRDRLRQQPHRQPRRSRAPRAARPEGKAARAGPGGSLRARLSPAHGRKEGHGSGSPPADREAPGRGRAPPIDRGVEAILDGRPRTGSRPRSRPWRPRRSS